MSPSLEARPFDRSLAAAIAELVARCTRGGMPPSWAADVLVNVITDPAAVRDLWRGTDRVGVGVSLDALETEGNAAELSLFCDPADDLEVVDALLDWGEARARWAGRDRVDVPHWPDSELPIEHLAARGYRVGHVMFDMKRPSTAPPGPSPRAALRDGWRWTPASARHARDYHETVRSAWRGLPGAFITSFPSFLRRLESYAEPPWLLLSDDPETPVAGFVRVERRADGTGELASIGRHPAYRGRGLGEHLMARGLARLEALGAGDVVLEVAASNAAGLALYRAFGFAVTREMNVYSRPLDRQPG